MLSHTVPRMLLEEFAFDGPVEGTRRLWRYQKDRKPFGRASTRMSTAWLGHFADPSNPTREEKLEDRLHREVEQPVNRFLTDLKYRAFLMDLGHRTLLTRYITVLFHRTVARRSFKDIQMNLQANALKAVMANEQKVAALEARHNEDVVERQLDFGRAITKEDVLKGLSTTISKHSTEEHSQSGYVDTVENMMGFRDEQMLNGQWDVIYTEPDDPFVIGDAPVVTWNRVTETGLLYGVGFASVDVEVLLPVAPTACLHIKPFVNRTRRIKTPTVQEVNEGQAAFATKNCFANCKNEHIDTILQPKFGQVKMGENAFTIVGIDLEEKMFEFLMNMGRKAA